MTKKKIFFLSVLMMLASCLLFGITMIRGIELRIVDDETNVPLSGVCIWYQMVKVKPKYLIDTELTTIITKKTVTNKNGIAIVKPNIVFLGLFQDIAHESIYINIDVNNEKVPEKIDYHLNWYFLSSFGKNYRNEKIFIPNNNYYPAMICNFPADYENGYMVMQVSDSTSNDIYGGLGWEGERFVQYPSLSDMQEKPKAIITVGLRRSRSVN